MEGAQDICTIIIPILQGGKWKLRDAEDGLEVRQRGGGGGVGGLGFELGLSDPESPVLTSTLRCSLELKSVPSTLHSLRSGLHISSLKVEKALGGKRLQGSVQRFYEWSPV